MNVFVNARWRRAFLLVAALWIGPAQSQAADVGAVLAEAARRQVGADQGVHVETADGTVLVSQAASRAVHPASVSKIPTTLALLQKLGPEHRFATRFLAAGPVESGTLGGDLVVEADGDPYFVDENVLLVALALREQGLRQVKGGLEVEGPLLFDWSADSAGSRLRRALAGTVSDAAWSEVREARELTGEPPALRFDAAGGGAGGSKPKLLVVHRSQPLVPLLKALNGFSNNIFHPFAQRVGGVDVVQQIARASVPAEMRDEILLTNGAGAGATNRLSPRASVALMKALTKELDAYGKTLADVLPITGVDPGTLRARLDDPGEKGVVAGKTGTFGDHGACALVGAYRAPGRGLVYFAVLNRGVPVPEARARQDAFVRSLLAAVPGEPWPYVRNDAPAFTRATVSVGP